MGSLFLGGQAWARVWGGGWGTGEGLGGTLSTQMRACACWGCSAALREVVPGAPTEPALSSSSSHQIRHKSPFFVSGHLHVKGKEEKMSKSLKNYITVKVTLHRWPVWKGHPRSLTPVLQALVPWPRQVSPTSQLNVRSAGGGGPTLTPGALSGRCPPHPPALSGRPPHGCCLAPPACWDSRHLLA